MKKIIASLLLLLSLAGYGAEKEKILLFSYFKGNGEDGLQLAYSRDGLNFIALNNDKSFLEPKVGVSKLMRDPCIIHTDDGTFHMVWTAGWTERGIGYSSSKDLVNWAEQKYLMVMEKEPSALNCWAPEISYDKKNKQFLIIWATTIPGRFAATDKGGDSGYNHRIYYVTTKDFKTFSETKLFYDKGFNVIDATINNNGKNRVMFVKDETRTPPQKNVRVTTSGSLYGPYSAPSEPITGKYWAEGPSSVKIKDTWYVYFDKYTENKMGLVKSKDLLNWEDLSDKVTFPAGVRHGTVFQVTDKILSALLERQSPYSPDFKSPEKIKGMSLIWNDEFNNSGKPDPAFWIYEKGFMRNQELQWYQAENANCINGVLIIEGKREKIRNPDYSSGSTNWKRSREYAEYTSASLQTRGLKQFQFGRFEIRARIDTACGSWPAIWTLGVSKSWPSNGEIDIMEFYRVKGIPTILANFAWGTGKNLVAKWDDLKKPLSDFTANDPEWSKKFHVWRMDWNKDSISLFLDDQLLNTVLLSQTVNPDGFNPFLQPHYILLNLALGGNGGVPSKTGFPVKYEVDYVRVYQNK